MIAGDIKVFDRLCAPALMITFNQRYQYFGPNLKYLYKIICGHNLLLVKYKK